MTDRKIIPVILLSYIILLSFFASIIYIDNIKKIKTMPSVSDIKGTAVVPKESSPVMQIPELLPVNKKTVNFNEKDKKEKNQFIILVVGDILLGRGVGARLEKEGKGYIYPFLKVADILKKGDIVFGNLEEPFTSSTKSLTSIKQGGKYILKNRIEAFAGIQYAGFNLLNLANNHILDYYEKGLMDTIELLDKYNIAHAGAGKDLEEARKPAVIDKDGIRVGILAYTDMSELLYKGDPPLHFSADKDKAGVAPIRYDYTFIKDDIQKLRSNADIIIISLHWGIEESFEVLPGQIEFAHNIMDLGADIILGHHPHQFQGIEIYKGKPFIYSLGNFIFDQNDPENQESFILEMKYNENKLTCLTAVPIRTIGKTQVVPQTGPGAADMLNREVELSTNLGSKCRIENNKIIFDLEQ